MRFLGWLRKPKPITPPIAPRASTAPTPRDDSTDFLIGMTTGFPMLSPTGFVGAAMHSSGSASSDPAPSHDNSSQDYGGSSSSYDSGSSYDGGGSSGGGSD